MKYIHSKAYFCFSFYLKKIYLFLELFSGIFFNFTQSFDYIFFSGSTVISRVVVLILVIFLYCYISSMYVILTRSSHTGCWCMLMTNFVYFSSHIFQLLRTIEDWHMDYGICKMYILTFLHLLLHICIKMYLFYISIFMSK